MRNGIMISATFALLSLAACAPIPPDQQYAWAGPWGDLSADRRRIGLDQEAVDQAEAKLKQDQQAGDQAAIQQDLEKLKRDQQRLAEDRHIYSEDRMNRDHGGGGHAFEGKS